MFRSAFLLAAAAFAAFTSAAPVEVSHGVAVRAPATLLGRGDASLLNVDHAIANSVPVKNNEVEVLDRRAECKTCDSLPGVFAFVDVKVSALLDKCKATVAKPDITVNVALDLLAEVKAVVNDLTVLVKAVVALNLDVNALLKLDGAVLTVKATVDLIVKVVVNILLAVDIVVKACVNIKLDVSAVLKVVADIVALVVALVQIILNIKVVVTLSAVLSVALKLALSVIATIDIKALIKVLVAVKV